MFLNITLFFKKLLKGTIKKKFFTQMPQINSKLKDLNGKKS
jgi:hypothetical protein